MSSFTEGKLDKLSDGKIMKIKKFVKSAITKILQKSETSGQQPLSSKQGTFSVPKPLNEGVALATPPS